MERQGLLHAAGLVALVLCCLQGCYSYAYYGRMGAPDFGKLPIDRNNPISATRWAYLWGLLEDEWAPLECVEQAADGKCKQYVQQCSNGAGRVEVAHMWYSSLMGLVTLGTVVPARVTIYCSTQRAGPDQGP